MAVEALAAVTVVVEVLVAVTVGVEALTVAVTVVVKALAVLVTVNGGAASFFTAPARSASSSSWTAPSTQKPPLSNRRLAM